MPPAEIVSARPDDARAAVAPAAETSSGTHPEARSRTRVVCAIPARYGSTRLPGKVLRELDGKPMIQHVWERASRAEGVERWVVLTDDERIARAVEGFGGEVEMTPAECRSGTDRIAAAAASWEVDAIVNVQGDEPLLDPAAVTRLARHLAAHPTDAMVTLATPAERSILDDPDKVKVVTDLAGWALYFSRAPVPFPRGESERPPLLHLGIYGYRRVTLEQLAALPPSPLERSESLEQLRALENGIRIRVLQTDTAAFGVDTLEDLEAAERLLRQRHDSEGFL